MGSSIDLLESSLLFSLLSLLSLSSGMFVGSSSGGVSSVVELSIVSSMDSSLGLSTFSSTDMPSLVSVLSRGVSVVVSSGLVLSILMLSLSSLSSGFISMTSFCVSSLTIISDVSVSGSESCGISSLSSTTSVLIDATFDVTFLHDIWPVNAAAIFAKFAVSSASCVLMSSAD